MYEIGNKRVDGKFNVWRKALVGNHYWEWIIATVCDSSGEASDFITAKNSHKARREKSRGVKQDA